VRSRQRNIFEKYGSLFFITSTVVGFIDLFNNRHLCEIFMENLKYYQTRGDYKIMAYVLMPNHFHLILKILPEFNISQCIGNLKRITSRKITEYLNNTGNIETIRRLWIAAQKESAIDTRIWKNRFDCFVINNEETLRQKIEYIHDNPVRQCLVENPNNWSFSSAKNYKKTNTGNIYIETDWNNLVD